MKATIKLKTIKVNSAKNFGKPKKKLLKRWPRTKKLPRWQCLRSL